MSEEWTCSLVCILRVEHDQLDVLREVIYRNIRHQSTYILRISRHVLRLFARQGPHEFLSSILLRLSPWSQFYPIWARWVLSVHRSQKTVFKANWPPQVSLMVHSGRIWQEGSSSLPRTQMSGNSDFLMVNIRYFLALFVIPAFWIKPGAVTHWERIRGTWYHRCIRLWWVHWQWMLSSSRPLFLPSF